MAGPDRLGFFSSVSAALFDIGADLGEAAFTSVGGDARFTVIAAIPGGNDTEVVRNALDGLEALEGADVDITPVEPEALGAPPTEMTHVVHVQGRDQPGFLARMTEALIDYGANIARLDTTRLEGSGGDDYRIRMYLFIPPERADACLAALDNTASQLGCSLKARAL